MDAGPHHGVVTTFATPLTAADVALAAARLRPYVRRTPVMPIELDGRRAVLKLEHLQRSGSFKLRGALNAVLAGDRSADIVAASGGNHGLGVATAAHLLGLNATVYVPQSAPEGKTRRIEAAGARLVRAGATFAEANEVALAAARVSGARYVHAYDDADVVAGQGTVAAEVVADAPEVDSIVVATGGGGLGAGTLLAAGGRRTVLVEPENCRSVFDALRAGRPVDAPVESMASSALGTTRAGTVPFGVLAAAGADVVPLLVSEAQIAEASDLLWDEFRIAAEPAAALPLAAWRAGLVPGECPCLVVCGANADWQRA